MAYQNHDVRKDPIHPAEAVEIVRQRDLIFVKRGRGVMKRSLGADNLTDEEILKYFLGRSGTMRAPVLLTPRGVMAGFEESIYRELLGL